MKGAEFLFRDELDVIAEAEDLLARGDGGVSREAFASFVGQYKKLYRQSVRLVRMGDRMQGQLNRLNEELAASEEKYRSIFENSIQGICRLTPEGRFLDLNPAMAGMFGHASARDMMARVKDMGADFFTSPEEFREFARELAARGALRDHCLRLRCRDGSSIWAEVCARGAFDRNGKLKEMECLVADATEKRLMIEKLESMARHDGLTGLWNRSCLLELGEREVARADREGGPLSLIFFDVDHFKRVNDTFGHDAGDRVLTALAAIGTRTLRKVDILARVGGEEFCALLPETPLDGAAATAEKLRIAVESMVVPTPGDAIRCTASFGVASRLKGDETLDDLLRDADEAMYMAKRSGRNAVKVWAGTPGPTPCRSPAGCPPGGCPGIARNGSRRWDRGRR